MTVSWACSAGVELLVGGSTCSVNSFLRPYCVRANAVQRSDQVVLINITLLFGAIFRYSRVHGLVFAVQRRLPEGNE